MRTKLDLASLTVESFEPAAAESAAELRAPSNLPFDPLCGSEVDACLTARGCTGLPPRC
ncbi:MAG TPA: hypothetical protein VF746_32120 [Longimicrobium sp.]|jgi:hypothetical protein